MHYEDRQTYHQRFGARVRSVQRGMTETPKEANRYFDLHMRMTLRARKRIHP